MKIWIATGLALLLAAPVGASPKGGSLADPHVTFIPGLLPKQCGTSASKTRPLCTDITFQINAVSFPNPDGGAALCLAYLDYNSLEIDNAKRDGGAVVTWKLAVGLESANPGIVFTEPPGHKYSESFDPPVDDKNLIRLTVKKKGLRELQFGHLPDVWMMIGKVRTHCGGADPGIIVHAG